MDIVDFSIRTTAIDGLVVLHAKQVTDERGRICEAFRRSTLAEAGVEIGEIAQVNVTTTRRGGIRGMHAEEMTKLTTVASGEAYGMYVDLRVDAPTFGAVEQVTIRPGVEVLVPAGVANGFQSLSDPSVYVYCFDREWQPGMAGRACTPLDPALAPHWPLLVDHDDPAYVSAKDRGAPTIAAVRAAGGGS
jgi:dTDP-4-dehydrorhamnose 3,5-epimerase